MPKSGGRAWNQWPEFLGGGVKKNKKNKTAEKNHQRHQSGFRFFGFRVKNSKRPILSKQRKASENKRALLCLCVLFFFLDHPGSHYIYTTTATCQFSALPTTNTKQSHVDAYKKSGLWSTSDVLILHLKRLGHIPGQYAMHRQR
jgi:hypothetical protein